MHHDILNELLETSGYDPDEWLFVVNGFRQGFDLGYSNTNKVQLNSPNLKLRVGDEIELWNKVMKEVKVKRFAGPFKEIPEQFRDDYIQSPIGLVPKDQGQSTRLIFHLSYPRQSKSKKSVNACTPQEICKVKYPDLNDAIRICLNEGVSCHLSKSDFSTAFRNLGILKHCWRYLLLKARSPLDGLWYYFVDKYLPFGASISCAHFQRVSNAITHLVKYRSGKPLINYLDDYLFISLLKRMCNEQLHCFLQICEAINFPVLAEKTEFASTCTIFLGFLIDSVKQIIGIPLEKISRAVNMIEYILGKSELPRAKRKITVRQLQRICGFLNFLSRAVIPGRAFTRRLYSHLCNHNLKPHHHLKVSDEMILDLRMWLQFVKHPSIYAHPFMDFAKFWYAEELQFYSDSSRNFKLGFGAYCETSWMQQRWEPGLQYLEPSIQYLELYALAVAVLAWGHWFSNKRIVIFTDNSSVVSMINKTSSSCKNCMVLIRVIVLHCLIHNVHLYVKFVSTKQYQQLAQLTKHMGFEPQPTPVPNEIWPISKIWIL